VNGLRDPEVILEFLSRYVRIPVELVKLVYLLTGKFHRNLVSTATRRHRRVPNEGSYSYFIAYRSRSVPIIRLASV
jgi:hypothetical protein